MPSNSSEKVIGLAIMRDAEDYDIILSADGMRDLVDKIPIADSTISRLSNKLNEISMSLYRKRTRGNGTGTLNSSNSQPELDVGAQILDLGSLVYTIFFNQDMRECIDQVPEGTLIVSSNDFSIPWELMYDGKDYLCTKFQMTRKIQVSQHRQMKERVVNPDRLKILFISDPTEDLPDAHEEVKEIVTVLQKMPYNFDIEVLEGKSIDRLKLLSSVCNYDILHFACHGHFDIKRPEKSCIYLSDGPLYASELSNRLSMNPPLGAFVNACESSKMTDWKQFQYENKIAGLANAFISAGVKFFIGANWPVHDNAAAHFAINFYNSIIDGKSTAKAIMDARKSVFEKFSDNEIAWASFTLFGDPNIKIVPAPQTKIDQHILNRIFEDCVNWISDWKMKNGKWGDPVYREQGIINTLEVLTILFSSDKELDETMVEDNIHFLIKQIDEHGFIGSPYEPKILNEDFNTSVVLTLYVFSIIEEKITNNKELIEQMNKIVIKCINWILENQQDDGGWSWGKKNPKTPSYIYYTSNSIYYLINSTKTKKLSSELQKTIDNSIIKGMDWLYLTQHQDGGWGVTSLDSASELNSTAYAIESLGYDKRFSTSKGKKMALGYIHKKLSTPAWTSSMFEANLRLVVPDKSPEYWPNDEDFEGQAATLNAFLSCWENDSLEPEDYKLVYRLLEHILANKEENKGWPQSYSTIYATTYNLHVLSRLVRIMENVRKKIDA